MNIPKDPVLLLSFTNTQLRDNFSNLDSFCDYYDLDKSDILDKLQKINYRYNETINQFK